MEDGTLLRISHASLTHIFTRGLRCLCGLLAFAGGRYSRLRLRLGGRSVSGSLCCLATRGGLRSVRRLLDGRRRFLDDRAFGLGTPVAVVGIPSGRLDARGVLRGCRGDGLLRRRVAFDVRCGTCDCNLRLWSRTWSLRCRCVRGCVRGCATPQSVIVGLVPIRLWAGHGAVEMRKKVFGSRTSLGLGNEF